MECIQSTILRSDTPTSSFERGKLLYQSKVIHPQSKLIVSAQIYSKMVIICDKYIPLIFDIRFHTKEHQIQFDYNEKLLVLMLPENDQNKWRDCLKNYLNQKGFHQKFKPMKKIGKGNFASVYLVQKLEDHQKYAVKAFSKQAAYSEQNGKQCLMKQIQIMKQLDHKNNMKLYEVFQSQNSLYFVFQLIQGGSLHQKMKSKYCFKPKEVQYIIKCLLEGLRDMHSKNIMHRDLKPENILIRKTQVVQCVIADFGLAEFSEADTYLFTRCGTPGFVAPQVINIKDMKTKYQPVCDIFSLGLIFYMLLFGKSLFKSKNYNDLVKQNRQSKFNFQEPQFESISQFTKDLIVKMLRSNPEQRISAEAALQHPYFSQDFEQNQQQDQEQNDIVEVDMNPKTQIFDPTPPLPQMVKNFRIKKDSCIEFKLGKESIFTGKTDSVGEVGSTKVSMMGANLLKGVKISKFSKQTKQNQPEVHH